MGQEMVQGKAARSPPFRSLAQIQLKGAAITFDAMGTQTASTEGIKMTQGDDGLALKEKQKTLLK